MPGDSYDDKKNTVRAVERALDILNIFSYEHDNLSFVEIVRKSQLPKATVYRLISTLLERKYLHYDAIDNKYMLGPRIAYLGCVSMGSMDLPRLALPTMEKLRDLTGQTITLYIRQDNDKVCIQKVESKEEIRLTAYLGKPLPVYAGASGLVLLSDMDDAQLYDYLSRIELSPLTPLTLTNIDALVEAVHKVQKQGYCISKGERQPGSAGIGCPIYNSSGQIVASLNISGPVERFPQEKLAPWVDVLKFYARELSEQLGYHGQGKRRSPGAF